MPNLSYIQYPGDGTVGPFVAPFAYLDRSHIAVSVDGTAAPFSFAGDASIVLETPAPIGSVVEVRRITPRETRLVDFTDGSVLTEADLDLASLQQLYIAQETQDLVADAVRLSADGAYAFHDRRARDLADPTSDQDAATKAYVDSTTATSAAAAAASATAAAGSADAASSSASSASSSASSASSSATAAAASAAGVAGGPVPDGGLAGQGLQKASDTDQDVEWGPKNNFAASTDPGVDDDATAGYAVGSRWINTTVGVAFTCVDASEGAAAWSDGAAAAMSVPIGAVMAWPAAAIPTGWLECDGAAVSRTIYSALFTVLGTVYGAGDSATTFNIPDLRGEFIRGLDNGRGVDVGRYLGGSQLGQTGAHKHQLPLIENSNASCFSTKNTNVTPNPFGWGDVAVPQSRSTTTSDTSAGRWVLCDLPYRYSDDEVSHETRPRNVAMKYCIKAADAVYEGATLPTLPDATTEEKGALEIATASEAKGMTETAKAVVPANLGWLRSPDVILEDRKTAGVGGGAASDGYIAWKKRDLTAMARDEVGATLSANALTLPAGRYYAELRTPGFGVDAFRCRLYDETNALVLGLGSTGYSAGSAQDWSTLSCLFALTGSAAISVQFIVATAFADPGALGVAANLAGLDEIYTRVQIWRCGA